MNQPAAAEALVCRIASGEGILFRRSASCAGGAAIIARGARGGDGARNQAGSNSTCYCGARRRLRNHDYLRKERGSGREEGRDVAGLFRIVIDDYLICVSVGAGERWSLAVSNEGGGEEGLIERGRKIYRDE